MAATYGGHRKREYAFDPGPGATNLVTPAVYAHPGVPMLMITGQKPIKPVSRSLSSYRHR